MAVAGHDRRAGKQPAQVRRGGRLPRVRAHGDQVGGERAVRAQQGLHAHGGREVGDPEQVLEVGQGQREHPEHPVRAVDEGQALLLGQDDRGESGLGQRLRRGAGRPIGADHLPLALQDDRHVRQRGEVTAAPEGPELVDGRDDPGVEQAGQRGDDLGSHAGAAGAQGVQPKRHHRPHRGWLHEGADAGRVRAGQADLQGGAPLRGDRHRGQCSEPGRDPVGRLRTTGQVLDVQPPRRDPSQGLGWDVDRPSAPGHVRELIDRQVADVQGRAVSGSGHGPLLAPLPPAARCVGGTPARWFNVPAGTAPSGWSRTTGVPQ